MIAAEDRIKSVSKNGAVFYFCFRPLNINIAKQIENRKGTFQSSGS